MNNSNRVKVSTGNVDLIQSRFFHGSLIFCVFGLKLDNLYTMFTLIDMWTLGEECQDVNPFSIYYIARPDPRFPLLEPPLAGVA